MTQSYQQLRLENKRRHGICTRCPNKAMRGKTRCKSHLRSDKKYAQEHHRKTVESGICTQCHREPASDSQITCRACRQKALETKRIVICHYGGSCACCGESILEFLNLDHVNDNGSKDRLNLGSGGRFYRWLLKNGLSRTDLRVLCFNCNCGRQLNGGICPHESLTK